MADSNDTIHGTEEQYVEQRDRCCQLTTHKLQQCYRCNRQTSITAGTIFEATQAAPDGVVPGHLP